MPKLTIITRLAVLVAEVERLKQFQSDVHIRESEPWWKKRVGIFKNDLEYGTAMELGIQYRQSQPMDLDDDLSA